MTAGLSWRLDMIKWLPRILWICIILQPVSRNTTITSHQLIEPLSTSHVCFSLSLAMVNTTAGSWYCIKSLLSLHLFYSGILKQSIPFRLSDVSTDGETWRCLLDHTEQSDEEKCDHERRISFFSFYFNFSIILNWQLHRMHWFLSMQRLIRSPSHEYLTTV